MRIRILLAAGLTTFALAPVSSANATACNDQMFPEVCAAMYQVCSLSRPISTVCGLFQ